MGVSFNVQKFEAYSHLRFHDTDDCEYLYFRPVRHILAMS